MEYSPDIPEDPIDVLLEPAFQKARHSLIEIIHNVIPDDMLTDEMDRIFYRKAGPEHLFPELDEDEAGERKGRIDIQLQVPFSYETGEILRPPFSGDTTEIESSIGTACSKEYIAMLPPDQRIVVTQYAFAERYDSLCKRIKDLRETAEQADALGKYEIQTDSLEEVEEIFQRVNRLPKIYARRMQKLVHTLS